MPYIAVIGGINTDVEGAPFAPLRRADSNPGRIRVSYGGVGRNITENVLRMGGRAGMLSVTGDDDMGRRAVERLEALGADVSHIIVKKGSRTAMYLSILDESGDMAVGLCDMDIVKLITPQVIRSELDYLRGAAAVAMDGNLSAETLAYAAEALEGVPLFFDPVSGPKAVSAMNVIGRFTCIKPNAAEAEVLSGIAIRNADDVKRAGDRFLDRGVEKVFITLGRDGVYYCDRTGGGFLRPAARGAGSGLPAIRSATGAGDSFSAAVLKGMTLGMSTAETARYGTAAASMAMEADNAVNESIFDKEIRRRMKDVQEVP